MEKILKILLNILHVITPRKLLNSITFEKHYKIENLIHGEEK